MNYTDKTKTLRLDSTLSQELPKLQAIVNTTWLSHWLSLNSVLSELLSTFFIFSFALIDILVGLVVQSALLEKSTWVFFFFFFSLQGRNSLWRIVADNA